MAKSTAHTAADDTPDSLVDGEETPKLKRKEYEKELRKLQTELCTLQDWVKATGLTLRGVEEVGAGEYEFYIAK